MSSKKAVSKNFIKNTFLLSKEITIPLVPLNIRKCFFLAFNKQNTDLMMCCADKKSLDFVILPLKDQKNPIRVPMDMGFITNTELNKKPTLQSYLMDRTICKQLQDNINK